VPCVVVRPWRELFGSSPVGSFFALFCFFFSYFLKQASVLSRSEYHVSIDRALFSSAVHVRIGLCYVLRPRAMALDLSLSHI
jgi:hypothetical protein